MTEISLDKIYKLMSSNDDSTEGITFRFIPDAYEVQAALKLQPDQKHFVGVPVFQVGRSALFLSLITTIPIADPAHPVQCPLPLSDALQAEGLTVRTKKDTLLPLFFSKADLDAAIRRAYDGKGDPKIEVGSFENVLRTMELVDEKESSDWMDVVFMPVRFGQ